MVEEVLYSDLLKTNCPVTGQPDWATLIVAQRGAPLDRAGLLTYLLSLRHHQDFHEHCVGGSLPSCGGGCARAVERRRALHASRRHRDQPLAQFRSGFRHALRPPGAAIVQEVGGVRLSRRWISRNAPCNAPTTRLWS